MSTSNETQQAFGDTADFHADKEEENEVPSNSLPQTEAANDEPCSSNKEDPRSV